jgi:Tfp pilus assembly protein PilO
VNARATLLLGLLTTALAAFVFYNFALKPKRAEATALSGQIEQQQQAVDTARALLASNQDARDRYKAAYATVIRLGKAVPADDDVRSLVVQLESAAKKTGVDFSSINVASGSSGGTATDTTATATALPPGATVGPAGFPIMQFTFTFSGQFFKLGDFFKRLHDFVDESNDQLRVSGRLLTLDSLQLQPSSAGFPKISASVGATTYLVSPLEGMTAGATAAGPSTTTGTTPTATDASGATPAATATPASGTTATTTTATSTGGIR